MKLISFTVPCYNSQDYMEKCIDSILSGGDDVECIIVNDGSKDNTLEIANAYKSKFPDRVKVIDKPNGGHGSGVNAGIATAEGLYFKVVDSDDWLDEAELKKLLDVVRSNSEKGVEPDLYVTNFIYDHVEDNTKHTCRYAKKIKSGEVTDWKKMKRFYGSQQMLMHALMYKHEVLKKSGMVLPEHTFYVDNIFAYVPLPYVKTLCYLDIDLYHYFIGRADQSVNISNIVKRYEQQIRVTQIMYDAYGYEQIKSLQKGLRKYMMHNLLNTILLAEFFTCADYSKERKAALKAMWRHMKEQDKKLYGKVRRSFYMTVIHSMPNRLRGKVMRIGYKIVCKKVKLG